MSQAVTPRRILIVRSAIEDFYEASWVRALRDNGHEVSMFDTFAHLTTSPIAPPDDPTHPSRSLDRVGWWQHRLLWGPRISAVNGALIAHARELAPDVVLMYLGHHYTAKTIRALRRHAFVTLFHSDDPFGPRRHHPRYRLVRGALRSYDGAHFYRPVTTADARAAGLVRSETLLDFFCPWRDYPRGGTPEHEAAFIGHFEPGLRVACLTAAARADLPVRVFSNERQWRDQLPADVMRTVGPRAGIYGDAYREKLSRLKISICFLSCWNRDTYTRRVFEIPACGGFLLCERTAFMQSLYEEDREAVFFSSPDEFVDKVSYYLSHEPERAAIAAAGRVRLLRDQHDVHTRLRAWAATVTRWMQERPGSACAS